MMFFVSGVPRADAEFAGGKGQPNDPYQIATAKQLISIGSDPNLLNKHFVLVADIDLDPNLPGGRVFATAVIAAPAGDPKNAKRLFFAGVFDGKNHTVKHLTIHADGTEAHGLFGEIGEGGRVCMLLLDGVYIKGGRRARRWPDGTWGLLTVAPLQAASSATGWWVAYLGRMGAA